MTKGALPWRRREFRPLPPPPVGLYPVTAAAAAAAEVGIMVEAAVGDCRVIIHPAEVADVFDDSAAGGLPPAESISDSSASFASPAAPMSLSFELTSKAASISSMAAASISSMAAAAASLALSRVSNLKEGSVRQEKRNLEQKLFYLNTW